MIIALCYFLSGLKKKAIPKFVNFVDVDPSGGSNNLSASYSQLSDLFKDVEILYKNPGYILQQCAYVNNMFHFKKIIEHENLSEADLNYQEKETGNNPLMIAAKMRHKDLLTSILRNPKFDGSDNVVLANLIHSRNKNQDTLLHTIALQGKSTTV